MAEIIKLGKIRKQRARAQKAALADANAVVFGRTKAQKKADETQRETVRAHLDGHRLDGATPGEDTE